MVAPWCLLPLAVWDQTPHRYDFFIVGFVTIAPVVGAIVFSIRLGLPEWWRCISLVAATMAIYSIELPAILVCIFVLGGGDLGQ